jgi:AbrB family looped-hinge helix DNA binding protein
MKSTVSSKGQITLPVEIRNRLGLRAGVVVTFEVRDGTIVIRKGHREVHPVDRLYGALRLPRSVDALVDEMRGPRPKR